MWNMLFLSYVAGFSKICVLGFDTPYHRIRMIQFHVFHNVFYLGISRKHPRTNSDSCFVAKIDVLFWRSNFAKEVLMGSFVGK